MDIGIKVVYVDPNDSEYGTNFVVREALLKPDLQKVEVLPKDGVLFIVLSTEWGNRQAMLARLWANYSLRDWHGCDNYVIGVVGDAFFFTEAYDEREDSLHCWTFAEPQVPSLLKVETPPRYPPEVRFVTFHGAWINSEVWHQVAIPFLEGLY